MVQSRQKNPNIALARGTTRLLPLPLFALSYMIAAVTGAAVARNQEFIFYVVVMVVLISVVLIKSNPPSAVVLIKVMPRVSLPHQPC